MKLKHWTLGAVALFIIAIVGFYSIFTIPKQPQLISIDHHSSQSDWYCHQSEQPTPAIDVNGKLNILVWNIHKQTDENWQSALESFSHDKQLILLQEASLTEEFTLWLNQQSWGASYVNAFKAFGVSSGVVNLASQLPNRACAYTSVEPWLQLPKSALYARYSLSNGQDLVVVNIHAINFTVGTDEFEQQIEQLQKAVQKHQGPLIIAGDFNTWSEARYDQLLKVANTLALQETVFSPDNRRLFVNDLAFDHVFYRGLNFNSASSPITTASDHNPMLVSFELIEN
ncbi:endonuclease/exonuclease/phosphatase family protein [Vibrio sp. CK2-1]|uniref:endonuclease/exonuclease/phosphatase family protein n=1 Tax=Vibrio sp. CK2-1 TaxID=2912249 RepID=UPI001F2BBB76|nr:endonuclease/exonuclease/phosphatase family protein [Vibrio sp. CK2-1]MCF7354325.1 endonuclease/exonuclease/phosphatase family protein [Vibrio sp. CK2-1]